MSERFVVFNWFVPLGGQGADRCATLAEHVVGVFGRHEDAIECAKVCFIKEGMETLLVLRVDESGSYSLDCVIGMTPGSDVMVGAAWSYEIHGMLRQMNGLHVAARILIAEE